MENLDNFITNNSMKKSEGRELDKVVLGYTRSLKSSTFNWFPTKLIVFTLTIMTLGLGVFFLPEKTREKVIKPVSAYEILTTTHNKLKELVETPGILHIHYVSTYEHEFDIDYDTVEVNKYIDNDSPRYRLEYLKTRRAGEIYTDDETLQSRIFEPEQSALLYEGNDEYYLGTYTYEMGTTREMAAKSYQNHREGLVGFYEFLLTKNADIFQLSESSFEGRDVYMVTFDYEGLALGVGKVTTNDFDLYTNVYTAEIIIDRETMLPVKHQSRVKDGSFEDVQTELFKNITVLDSNESSTVSFEIPSHNYQEPFTENKVIILSENQELTGTVTYSNPGENVVSLQIEIEGRKYSLHSDLLSDYLTSKSTIMGKFVAGQEISFVGSFLKYGETGVEGVWIKEIDFEQFVNGVTTTPAVSQQVTAIPSGERFSFRVYDAEYERTKADGIKISGVLPKGAKLDNIEKPGLGILGIDGENYEFTIAEWYRRGPNLIDGQLKKLATNHLGGMYRYEYTPQASHKYIQEELMKLSGTCEDYWGETISAPCGRHEYSKEGVDYYLSITCSLKANLTTQEESSALRECDEIVQNLDIE